MNVIKTERNETHEDTTAGAGGEKFLADYAKDHGLARIEDFEPFPKYFLIESCGACNARCIMCPVSDVARDTKLMPDDLFNILVEQIKPHAKWVKQVALQAQGEPTIDKKLEKKIRAMKEIGIETVTIISNGSLMTAKRAESILEAGLDFIDFSVDGATKATFDAIRLRLDYDEVRENIENFIKARDRINPDCHIRIRFTIQDQNRHEFEDFKAYWRDHLGGNPKDLAYGKELHHWANWMEGFEPYEDDGLKELNATPCQSPFSTFAVLNDGRIALCCNDYNAEVCLGNVYDNTIEEIWQGQKFRDVRSAHRKEGRCGVDICVNCNAWDPKARIL
ncbi:MAG: radical SAM protein [Rhodospirillales bacterium]